MRIHLIIHINPSGQDLIPSVQRRVAETPPFSNYGNEHLSTDMYGYQITALEMFCRDNLNVDGQSSISALSLRRKVCIIPLNHNPHTVSIWEDLFPIQINRDEGNIFILKIKSRHEQSSFRGQHAFRESTCHVVMSVPWVKRNKIQWSR